MVEPTTDNHVVELETTSNESGAIIPVDPCAPFVTRSKKTPEKHPKLKK